MIRQGERKGDSLIVLQAWMIVSTISHYNALQHTENRSGITMGATRDHP